MKYLLTSTIKLFYMRKLLFLTMIFCAIIATSTYAQSNAPSNGQSTPDPAVMLQQLKEKFKPQMVEKTGLTEAQADKVIEINFELRQSMVAFKDLNEADRAKKVAELKVTREKKWSEIPLTPEQIKAVYAFYEDMGKNAPQKREINKSGN